jgi:proteasome lid subunit RPN8/RPN11
MSCSVNGAVLSAVAAHAREASPAECCGVLLGAADRIFETVRARNLSDDPNRFVIDPQDHIAARRDARVRGLQVVGFYHSHPHSEPSPSAADIAEASYDGCLYLIVSLVSEPAARLFQMNAGGPRELQMSIDAP